MKSYIIKTIIVFLCFLSLYACRERAPLSAEVKGNIAFSNHAYKKAVQYWSYSLDKFPEKKYLVYKIGNAYLKLADINLALEYFEKSEKFFPKNLSIKKDIIRIFLIKGFIVKAQEKLESISIPIKSDAGLCILKGDILLFQGNYKEAENYYKEAVFLSKGLPKAYLKLAFCLNSKGKKAEAAEIILKIIQENKEIGSDDAVLLSDYLFDIGKYEAAEKYLLKALEIKKDAHSYKIYLCEFYIKTKQKEKAVKNLITFCKKYPENIKFHLMLADLFLSEHNMTKAYEVLESVKKIGINSYDYNLIFGKYWLFQGNAGRAIACLKAACDEKPYLFSGYYMLGLAYFANGQKKLAENSFIHALVLMPDNIDCLLALADLHYKNKEYFFSIGYIEKVLKIDPLNMRANRLKGLCYIEQNKEKEAFSYFVRAFYDKKDLSSAYYLGRTFEFLPESLAQRARILDYYSIILGEKGFVPEIFLRYLFLLVDEKKHTLVKKLLQGAYFKDSKNYIENYIKGFIYLKLEDYDTARSIFESLFLSGKYSKDLFLRLISIYEIKGIRDKLKEILIRFTEVYPYCNESWLKLSDFYVSGRRLDEALETLKKGVEKNPESIKILANLAWLITENNGEDLEKALDYARSAYEIDPEKAYVADTLGWVYFKKKAYSQAEWMFKEAESKAPDKGIVKYHLGLVLYEQGKLKQASSVFKEAIGYNLSTKVVNKMRKILSELESFKMDTKESDEPFKDNDQDFLVFPEELEDLTEDPDILIPQLNQR